MPYDYLQDEEELPGLDAEEPVVRRPFVGPRKPFTLEMLRAAAVPTVMDEAPSAPMPHPDAAVSPRVPSARELGAQPDEKRYSEALDSEAKLKGARPKEQPPKWWQRLAAGAVGGLAGLANSSGRGAHIDPTAAIGGIYGAEGKQRRLSDWTSKVEGAEAKTAAAKGTLDAWRQGRNLDRQEQLAVSQIEENQAQAEQRRAAANAPPKDDVREVGGSLVRVRPGGKAEEIYSGKPELKSLEQMAVGVIADSTLTPEQKKQKLDAIGSAHNTLHPTTPIHGFQTDKNGNATLVIADPKNPAAAQKIPLGQIGKPQQAPAASASGGEADDIAQAIIEGKQPPDMKGLYRFGAPVRAKLAKEGYDLTTATRDWQAVTKHIATLNGPQQERLRQAVNFTYDSLDQIEGLYNEWKQVAGVSGLKVLNRGNLAISKQLGGKAGEVAQSLEAQINDLTSELGTVYKGGNGSTDESLRLAGENLKADWNEQTFKRALEQIRKNLQIRRNSINSSQPAGVSEGSRYVQPQNGRGSAAGTPKADPLGIR